jgi:hypothetical protein
MKLREFKSSRRGYPYLLEFTEKKIWRAGQDESEYWALSLQINSPHSPKVTPCKNTKRTDPLKWFEAVCDGSTFGRHLAAWGEHAGFSSLNMAKNRLKIKDSAGLFA